MIGWLRQLFCSHPDTETEWVTNEVGKVTTSIVTYWTCHRCGKRKDFK